LGFNKTDKSRAGEFLKFDGQGMRISNRSYGMYTSYGHPLQHADAMGSLLNQKHAAYWTQCGA